MDLGTKELTKQEVIKWALLKARRIGIDCCSFGSACGLLEQNNKFYLQGVGDCDHCLYTVDLYELFNETVKHIEDIEKYEQWKQKQNKIEAEQYNR